MIKRKYKYIKYFFIDFQAQSDIAKQVREVLNVENLAQELERLNTYVPIDGAGGIDSTFALELFQRVHQRRSKQGKMIMP